MTHKPGPAHRRDPRASSPGRFKRRVSVPETCSFYGAADAISSCRVPRSCADCLAKPGCMLMTSGLCQATDTASNTFVDARSLAATQSSSSQPPIVRLDHEVGRTPVFYSENVTYCGTSDSTCALCRRGFESMARANWSTRNALKDAFCVGDDGRCICSGVCEVPDYRASQVQDYGCDGPTHYYAAGHALPSFSSKRRDPRAPLLPLVLKRERGETCGFYSGLDLRGCREPRLPSDCIERAGCMISSSDGCVDALYPPMNLVNATTVPIGLAMSSDYFVAGNASICELEDPMCSSCASDITLYMQGRPVDSSNMRCVGESGCICFPLLSRQDAEWLESHKDPECASFAISEDEVVVGLVAGFITVMLLVGGCLRYAVIRSRLERMAAPIRDQAARVLRHMIDNAPGGLNLDLFGWRRFQQSLREHEARLLQGEENVSPVARPMDLKDWLTPSAPALEELEDATAPTRSDPMALASAPPSALDITEEVSIDESDTITTAPDFDDSPRVTVECTRRRQSTHAPPRGS